MCARDVRDILASFSLEGGVAFGKAFTMQWFDESSTSPE